MKNRKTGEFFCAIMALALITAIFAGCNNNSGGSNSSSAAPTEASSSAGAGASSEQPAATDEIDFPTKPITLIIPWAAGSSGDNGARILMPYVEENLGTNITVINNPGASGWLGWDEVASANPDGYTISLLTLPSFYSGYMDPQNDRDTNLDSFSMIANQVSDWAMFYGQGNETRWTNLDEMIEYAKENELTVGVAGQGSDDNMMLERFKKQHPECKFSTVFDTSSGNIVPMVLGGHIDLMMGNLGDANTQVKSGELSALCLFARERSEILPDLPTYQELGYSNELIGASDRGYFMPAGADPAVLAKLQSAFEQAISNTEHIRKMSDIGINVNYMNADELTAYAKQQEQTIEGLKGVLGWE